MINNLRIPGLQTRRAKTTVELRDGESFAMAGLIRKDFQDTVRQFPILGSIPIIGIAVPLDQLPEGRDRAGDHRHAAAGAAGARRVAEGADRSRRSATEADLFFLGRTDAGVPPGPVMQNPHPLTPVAPPGPAGSGGSAQRKPIGFEKEYGHVL